MKTKENYIQPVVEVIELDMEEEIMATSPLGVDTSGDYEGQAGIRGKRGLWD